jgi:hypothetical protein
MSKRTYMFSATTKSALVIMSCLIAVPANASPAEDVFGHNTNGGTGHSLPPLRATSELKHEADTPKVGAGSGAMMSGDAPIVKWFESYDITIANAKPTSGEQLVLYRPMNQEIERVKQVTATCGIIAKRFRATSKALRRMPVQANWPEVKELRDNQAEFYDQEASVYESMIRPRPPSRTQEEYDATIKDLQYRAEQAKSFGENLISMDLTLRHTYGVHLSRDKDDLAKYVMSVKKDGMYSTPK